MSPPAPKPVAIKPAAVTKLPPQYEAGPLNPDQIRKRIVGKTGYGPNDTYVKFLVKGRLDGRIQQNQTDFEDSGSWSIDRNGKICMSWDEEEFATSGCFAVKRVQKEIQINNARGQSIFVVPL